MIQERESFFSFYFNNHKNHYNETYILSFTVSIFMFMTHLKSIVSVAFCNFFDIFSKLGKRNPHLKILGLVAFCNFF
jgi:hypothetical protein